ANVEAHYNRGVALQQLHRFGEALASYDHALALRPEFPEALNNRGFCLQCLQRYGEARESYDRALEQRPNFADALYNRGASLSALHRHDEAVRDIARALTLNPDLPYARGTLLHSRMYACDWREFERASRAVLEGVRRGERSAEPLTI